MQKLYMITLVTCGLFAMVLARPAMSQVDPYVGQLMLVGFNFCPRGWTPAEGQVLPIAQNQALFSLYGTMYGGDGRTTFALPDLRGRAPINMGAGPGLQSYSMGQRGGEESFSITTQNMPTHNHLVQATNEFADRPGPGGKLLAADNTGINKFYRGPPTRVMDGMMLTDTGNSQPIQKRSPYLSMKWCVALLGTYPSRN